MKFSKELLDAYLDAEYRVFTPQGMLVLTAKGESSELADLHDELSVQHSAFITAYNPYSKKTDDSVNLNEQKKLINEITGRWQYLRAEGVDQGGAWPVEQSVLILGINLEEALDLGRKYHQHAIVFASGNRTELHLCKAPV